MEENKKIETLDMDDTLKENKELEETVKDEPIETHKKKGNVVGIIIIVFLILIAIAGVSLYAWNNNRESKMKKIMTKAAVDYYENYTFSNTSAGAYTITLADLKKAKADYGKNYDLKFLDKCDDEKTSATVTIDYSDGKIKDTTIKLNCKIY